MRINPHKPKSLVKLMSIFFKKKQRQLSYDIILVDDDPVFGHLFMLVASRYNLNVYCLSDIEQLRSLNWPSARAVLIDYDLERINGVRLISLLKASLKNSWPSFFLVSENKIIREVSGTPLEQSFISKSIGIKLLFESVLNRIDSQSSRSNHK